MTQDSFMSRYFALRKKQFAYNWAKAKQMKICYLFLLPYLLLFIVFLILPIGTSVVFSFTNYNAHDMFNTIKYAQKIYDEKKDEWDKIVVRAMEADFSWFVSAKKYQEMYDWLIG